MSMDDEDRELTDEELEAFLAPMRQADREERIFKWIVAAIIALTFIHALAFTFLEEAWPRFVPTPTIVLPICVVAILAVTWFWTRQVRRLILGRHGAPPFGTR